MPSPATPVRVALLLRCLLLLPPVAGVIPSIAISAEDARKQSFDIPAGRASETLKRFASQAGREIVFSPDTVAETRTQAVRGSHTAREALDLMLLDTGLVARQDAATGAFSIRKEGNQSAKALAGAIAAGAAEAEKQERSLPASDTSLRTTQVDGVTTLSPFEVNTDRDVGYTASNSLAGGRLNTDLRDTAAAISVLPRSFSTTSASRP